MKNTAFLFLSNYLCHVPSRHNIIMTLTLKTNKWASRLIIILQLTVWSTVSVVLLQKGISSLQKRILETSNNVIKVCMYLKIYFFRLRNRCERIFSFYYEETNYFKRYVKVKDH